MEEMINISKCFYRSLKVPFQIVTIVTGEMNKAAAKKYDLEGWFPTLGQYRELVSCSNCTDYQSRSMNIRFSQVNVMGKKTICAYVKFNFICY